MAGKVIFHIDLNAFFASAEILKNTALEGQPLVVAGMHRRSVVSTASYEARALGIHSAMPLMMALQKCPQLVVVQGDYHWYEELSNRFFKYLHQFTPYIEPASIDECYMDVSEVIKKFKRPMDLAWMIQKKVYDDLHLSCSIGVAPNKFLAKMASDMRKPMGITILRKQEVAKKLWVLPISDMYGIGKKSVPNLQAQGIFTIGDFADPANESKIMNILGKHAYVSIQHARGNGSNRLSYNTTLQSLSQSTTLDNDINDYDEIKTVFKRLSQTLSKRAQMESMKGSLITVSIRYFDFTNVMRSMPLPVYTNDASMLLEHALLLFDRHANEKSIRHLGIGLGSLQNAKSIVDQLDIFQSDTWENVNDIQTVLKSLNASFQDPQFMRASDILKKK